MKTLVKYLPSTIKYSKLVTLLGHDALRWSKSDKNIRIRLVREECDVSWIWGANSMFELLNSKTKAHNFHGYLEGDYIIATSGFYTNNMKGVARLFEKYSHMFESIQTYEQYKTMNELASQLMREG
jgi:hypothetical protein